MLYPDLCAWLHRFDAILQPSRCEGAGMVGKESLAAGVPFVGTFDTGHSDYLPAPGAVKVPTVGRVRAKAYGVGMEACYPDVRFDDIMRAVEELDDTYESVEAAARGNAEEFAKAHSWRVMAERLHNFLLQVEA
jgi:glycosyltransferase involved in cell wall biosynthesis